MHVLAAGACPDLSAFKPVVERGTAVLLAAIGGSILAGVVYAGFKYHGSPGKQQGIGEGKSLLIHSAKGLAMGALAVPLVAPALRVPSAPAPASSAPRQPCSPTWPGAPRR